jgi:hypothetical protein
MPSNTVRPPKALGHAHISGGDERNHRFGKTKPKSGEILVFGKTKPKSCEISVFGLVAHLGGVSLAGQRTRELPFTHHKGFIT